jgi:hypothetical protein
MHARLERLKTLWENATPGNWGPTTSSPRNDEGVWLKDGERGEATWGAVVSDTETPREGVDHNRYELKDGLFYEKGADYYGGTFIGESFAAGNGELVAEAHNALPHLVNLINTFSATLVIAGVHPNHIDQIIEDEFNGK